MSKKSRTGIDSIETREDPGTGKNWASIIQKFNPLGAAAEAYGKTLAYRLESKRIDAEIERVRKQGEVMSESINKTFDLNMEQLQHRRLAINRFFDTVQGELGQHHLERMTVIKMAEKTTEHMLEPGLSIEERQNCREMVSTLTAQIPVFADNANKSLQTLFEALPKVELPKHLLLSE